MCNRLTISHKVSAIWRQPFLSCSKKLLGGHICPPPPSYKLGLKFVYFFVFHGPNPCCSEDRNFFCCPHNGLPCSRFSFVWKLFSVWVPLIVMVAFSIATSNVDGIRDDSRRARIFLVFEILEVFFLSASRNSCSS